MKEAKDYNPSKDPRLINCKTECGNERCFAKRYGLFAEKTCPNFVEPKLITNADRIRSMTDEELAEFLTPVKCVDCHLLDCGVGEICDNRTCEQRIRDWLKQEVSTNG